jgi:hypothetical protein
MDEFYSNCTNYSAVLEKNPKNDKWWIENMGVCCFRF